MDQIPRPINLIFGGVKPTHPRVDGRRPAAPYVYRCLLVRDRSDFKHRSSPKFPECAQLEENGDTSCIQWETYNFAKFYFLANFSSFRGTHGVFCSCRPGFAAPPKYTGRGIVGCGNSFEIWTTCLEFLTSHGGYRI